MVPFCDKFKHVKKSLKVNIFLNFFGKYKEVRQVADISTTFGNSILSQKTPSLKFVVIMILKIHVGHYYYIIIIIIIYYYYCCCCYYLFYSNQKKAVLTEIDYLDL